MKTPSKIVSVLLASVAFSLSMPSAMAQPSPGFGMGGMACSGERTERRAEMRNARHEKLHGALKLSAAQETAWKTYQSSIKPPACPAANADGATLSAPERADLILENMKQMLDNMSAHVAAMKTFYAGLSPEQKKTFDSFHAAPRGGRGAAPAVSPAEK